MDKNWQDIITLLGLDYSKPYLKKVLIEQKFSSEDIKNLKTYRAYIFWYYALESFKKNKATDNDWELNYLTLSFLRYGMLNIKNTTLQKKMVHFIIYQNIKNANDIQVKISDIISPAIIKKTYLKALTIIPSLIEQDTKNRFQKKMYIIAGANGSGKSTLAQQIISNNRARGSELVFINADEIAKELNPKDINSVKIKAGKIALKKAIETLDEGKSFIVESTLSGKIKETRYSLKTTITKAKSLNYAVNLLYIYIEDSSLCKERIKVRVIKGGHNVPDDDVERRYKRSLQNFFEYINIVDNWTLYSNNTSDFNEIAKSSNRKIEITDTLTYNKIKKAANI